MLGLAAAQLDNGRDGEDGPSGERSEAGAKRAKHERGPHHHGGILKEFDEAKRCLGIGVTQEESGPDGRAAKREDETAAAEAVERETDGSDGKDEQAVDRGERGEERERARESKGRATGAQASRQSAQ